MRWSRRILLILLGLALMGGLVFAFLPRPVPVDTQGVSRGPLAVTVTEEGKTRVEHRYVVSAPVAGYAHRITLDAGDAVQVGDVLVALDPVPSEVLDPRRRAEAQARVASARGILRSVEEIVEASRADADFASTDYERQAKLLEQGSISRETLDRAEAEKRRTAAMLRAAEFGAVYARYELEAARTALRYAAEHANGDDLKPLAIRAPIEGRVLRLYRESEGVVDMGDPLVELGDTRRLEVETDVLSADAVRIGPGTHVRFDRWGGGEALEGMVRTVEPRAFTKVSALGVEEQRVLVISDITTPPSDWGGLGDGYRVEASFLLWESQDVLRVPNSALFRLGEGWTVFTVDGGRARQRTVQIGHRNALEAEVLSGLADGEVVIVHPTDAVIDGGAVRAR